MLETRWRATLWRYEGKLEDDQSGSRDDIRCVNSISSDCRLPATLRNRRILLRRFWFETHHPHFRPYDIEIESLTFLFEIETLAISSYLKLAKCWKGKDEQQCRPFRERYQRHQRLITSSEIWTQLDQSEGTYCIICHYPSINSVIVVYV